MNHDTRHFAEELAELKQRLLVMGGLAEERLQAAVRAMVERDRDLMAAVISGDEAINRLHLEIDDRCFKLLALRQPMAVDLRTIVAAFKINSDLERIGDLAVNVAEAAERYVSSFAGEAADRPAAHGRDGAADAARSAARLRGGGRRGCRARARRRTMASTR